jgi:hypothetical protein
MVLRRSVRPTTICTQTPGILPVKWDVRHPEGGSDPDGIRVPPGAGEMERWAFTFHSNMSNDKTTTAS